jgi:hypothetical protein
MSSDSENIFRGIDILSRVVGQLFAVKYKIKFYAK